MFNRLRIKNFKCFNDLELNFSMVNVLTGLNGMGKSTVIQSILLLGQSQKNIMSDKSLLLKGKYVDLGVGKDILFEKAEEDEVGIELQIDDNEGKFLFEYQPEEDVLPLKNWELHGSQKAFEQWTDRIYYLSAYRIEPQFLYRIENERELSERYFGKDGKFAIQYLKL